MSHNYFYISLFSLVLLGSILWHNKAYNSNLQLETLQTEFVSGDTVRLVFGNAEVNNISLYCSNSYGSIVIQSKKENDKISFTIPDHISKKSGTLNWQIIGNSNPLRGTLFIKPQPSIKSTESYIGPPSIEAGGTDYSMLVVIPTDKYDNPLIDSTKVEVKHQFLQNEVVDDVFTKHGIAYKNIYSYEKNGRILLSSTCLGLNSKEYDISIMPAIPTEFTITANRIHEYADGNQITTFKTSQIRDRYDNIVSDGTFVTFFITDQNGNKTTTSGSTINGIATAKMLHPDRKSKWRVKAYIEGMANSNSISLVYKQAVSDFEVEFSENNRIISVGPLQSFMNQRVPDGLEVTLKVYRNNTLDAELLERSYLGYASFKLNPDRYPNGNYSLIIETAGLTKSFNNITYE